MRKVGPLSRRLPCCRGVRTAAAALGVAQARAAALSSPLSLPWLSLSSLWVWLRLRRGGVVSVGETGDVVGREGHAAVHRSAVHGPHAAGAEERNKKAVRKNAMAGDGTRMTDLLALEGKWDGTGEFRESCDL